MEKAKFHPFQMIRGRKKSDQVLGWQYEMIYLDGDPHNPEQAIVHVRVLEKAIVIRANDGKEETFCSVHDSLSADKRRENRGNGNGPGNGDGRNGQDGRRL